MYLGEKFTLYIGDLYKETEEFVFELKYCH